MPAIHDYESSNCHRTVYNVFFAETNNIPSAVPCVCGDTECQLELVYTGTGHGRVSIGNAGEQSFGVTYFKEPSTGRVMVQPDPSYPQPVGWEKHTTTSYASSIALERLIQQDHYQLSAESQRALHEATMAQEKELRDEVGGFETLEKEAAVAREERIKAEIEKYGRPGNYNPGIQDPIQRARLARDTIKYVDQELAKKRSSFQPIDTEVHLPFLHNMGSSHKVDLPSQLPDNPSADDRDYLTFYLAATESLVAASLINTTNCITVEL
jgi:hypothetical protein